MGINETYELITVMCPYDAITTMCSYGAYYSNMPIWYVRAFPLNVL